jgi:phospholipase C
MPVAEMFRSCSIPGFYTPNGINCLGYYTGQDLPFYYSLFASSALCANFFCAVMGPTHPNRFYLVAGTSGVTTNGIWGIRRVRLPDHS